MNKIAQMNRFSSFLAFIFALASADKGISSKLNTAG
jgi:hypothetical protein